MAIEAYKLYRCDRCRKEQYIADKHYATGARWKNVELTNCRVDLCPECYETYTRFVDAFMTKEEKENNGGDTDGKE